MFNNSWLKKVGKIITTLVVITATSLTLQSCSKIIAPTKSTTLETMPQQTNCDTLTGDAYRTKQLDNTNNSTKPTNQHKDNAVKFDESKYPNFYVVTGKAQVNRQLNDSEIIYSKFDQYGRTQGVYAKLNHKNLTYGMRPRENISDIKPSGWIKNQRVELQFADGTKYHGYFYNRSHLLAHFLGGDDADYNMITGTRAQNVGKNNRHGGMQYTENLAHDYLRKHPNGTVYYAVVPNYIDSQLVPITVTVDIQSDDKSIDQHVIVFNNAPGYNIDYATGKYYKK